MVADITLPMIKSFATEATRDLFNGRDTRAARQALPRTLWRIARRKLDQVHVARRLGTLVLPPGNRLEWLAGDRRDQHSIRINAQYRLCFRWEGEHAWDVEIVDYH